MLARKCITSLFETKNEKTKVKVTFQVHGLASLDDRVPKHLGEEREDNGVAPEIQKEDSGHVSLSEGDSVIDMDFVEDNEDNSGAVEGELRNFSDESLPVITKNQGSANGNFRDDERLGFPGDASSQQTHNTKITISVKNKLTNMHTWSFYIATATSNRKGRFSILTWFCPSTNQKSFK